MTLVKLVSTDTESERGWEEREEENCELGLPSAPYYIDAEMSNVLPSKVKSLMSILGSLWKANQDHELQKLKDWIDFLETGEGLQSVNKFVLFKYVEIDQNI